MKKYFLIIISILSLIMVGCATSNETVSTSNEEISTLSEVISTLNKEQSLTLNDISGEYVLIDDSSENVQMFSNNLSKWDL